MCVCSLFLSLSQFVYESTSTLAYLGLQEAARGGGWRRVVAEVRSKFWRAWTSGILFFSSSHLLMFLAPIWLMQPILDNLSCLAFNTYLAMLSHEPTTEQANDDLVGGTSSPDAKASTATGSLGSDKNELRSSALVVAEETSEPSSPRRGWMPAVQ